MARELFVYWRVAPGDAEAALAATAQWQQQLRQQHPPLIARLYRRSDEAETQATVMETYAMPGVGIGDALQAAIEDAPAAVASWRIGARHQEVFDEIPSTAWPR